MMTYGPDIEDFARDALTMHTDLLRDLAGRAPDPTREFLIGCVQALEWLARDRLDPITGTHAIAGRMQRRAVTELAAERLADPRCAGVLAVLVLSGGAFDGAASYPF
jgi:hypothetical protein